MPELGKHYITITQASTRKSARVLGFRAQVDLKSGIGMQMGKKVDA